MPAQDVCAGLRYNEETAAEAHSRRRFLPIAGRRADVPRKLFFRLKDGFPRVKLCFCVLCVLTYLALIRVSGAKLWGLFVFFLCAAVYLYLPGRFWARVTGMEKVLQEFAVPLGVLLGTGFLAVLYCVSMRLGVLWLLRALPPVLGLLCCAVCMHWASAFTAAIGTRRYCSPSPCFCSTAPACGQL